MNKGKKLKQLELESLEESLQKVGTQTLGRWNSFMDDDVSEAEEALKAWDPNLRCGIAGWFGAQIL